MTYSISGVSWDEYEALLAELGDRSGTRILYRSLEEFENALNLQ
jgi:hypothetical protein